MYDVNKNNTEKILAFCKERSIEVVGMIPFNPKVTEAMVRGKTIVEYSPGSDVTNEIRCIWEKITVLLNQK